MPSCRVVTLLCLSLLTGCLVAASEEDSQGDPDCTEYDLVTDFSDSLNPSGPWGYGWSTGVGGFSQLSATTSADCGSTPVWSGGGQTNIWRNRTAAATCFGVVPGQVSMHPGSSGELVVVRFTAPTSGEWAFQAQFSSGDLGDTDVTVVRNGTAIATLPTTSTNPSFSRTLSLVTGDTIDFDLGAKGDWSYDNTPASIRVRCQ